MSNSLSTYYYTAAIFFIISTICDIIFYSTFITCPLGNTATSLFMFLIILNTVNAFLLLKLGFLVNFFYQMDPEELLNLGWFKKLLGILVKLYPTLVKIIHYVKFLIVLICAYFAFFNNTPNTDYINDVNFDKTTLSDQNCLNISSSTVTKLIENYPKQVVVFEGIEIAVVLIMLCIFGAIKNLLDIEGYFYEPEDPRHGGCRKFLFRRLGP